MKKQKSKLKKLKKINFSFLAYPFYLFFKFLTASLRYTQINREKVETLHENGERLIFCIWHDELISILNTKADLDVIGIVSPSKDGDLVAKVIEYIGFRAVRGSSTRQGMNALLTTVKVMTTENIHACMTVDGPLGPRHKVKDGAFFLGHHADAYIVPMRTVIKNSYKFNSWDKFQIPYPFTKVKVVFGEPYKVSAEKLDAEVLASEKAKLQTILETLLENDGQ